MGQAAHKITGYGLAFGAACAAPSVDTLNAISAIAAGKMLFDIAPYAAQPVSAIGTRLRETFNMKARSSSHAVRKAMKIGLLSGAGLLGGAAIITTADDVFNDNQEFSHALGSNVAMPVYNLARSAATNIIIPAGENITRGLNSFIGSATGYDMPEMNVTPAFTAQSSLRARCIEPVAYNLLDGTIAAIDQNITDRARTHNAQEAIDTLSLDRHVHYKHPPLCF